MPRHKSRKRARRSRRKRGGDSCQSKTLEQLMIEQGIFQKANEFAQQYGQTVTDLDSFIKVGKYFTEGQGDYSFTPKLNAFAEKAKKSICCNNDIEQKIPEPWGAFLVEDTTLLPTKGKCIGTHDDKMVDQAKFSFKGGRRRRRKSRRKSKKRRRKTKKRRRRRRR